MSTTKSTLSFAISVVLLKKHGTSNNVIIRTNCRLKTDVYIYYISKTRVTIVMLPANHPSILLMPVHTVLHKVALQTLIENYKKSKLSGVILSSRMKQIIVEHIIAAATLLRDYSSISRIICTGRGFPTTAVLQVILQKFWFNFSKSFGNVFLFICSVKYGIQIVWLN